MLAAIPASADEVTWVSDAGGEWHDPAHWSSNPLLPGVDDDVLILARLNRELIFNSPPGQVTTVHSLNTTHRFRLEQGTLDVQSLLSIGPYFILAGGHVRAATIDRNPNGIIYVTGATASVIERAVMDVPITVAGGSLILRDHVRNRGIITLGTSFYSGRLIIEDSVTANLGTVLNGTVEFRGHLDNSNATLASDKSQFVLNGGTIHGGFVRGRDIYRPFSLLSGTLDAVTLQGETPAIDVRIMNGLTLDNARVLLSPSYSSPVTQLEPIGPAQTIGGVGEIRLGRTASLASTPGEPLTLGPGITVTGSGTIGAPERAIINQGTILADESPMTVHVSHGFRNDGVMRIASSGILIVDGDYTVEMLGRIHADPRSLPSTTGLFLRGNIINTGRTFSLHDSVRLQLAGATISGGRLASINQTPLVIRSGIGGMAVGDSTFDGVTVAGAVTIEAGALRVPGDLPLDGGEVNIAGELRFDTDGEHRLTGHGIVNLGGPYSYGTLAATQGALTIDENIVIRAVPGGTLGADGIPLVNRGTIDAHRLTIKGASFLNEGALHIRPGGTLTLGLTPQWPSPGPLLLDRSSLYLGGTYTTRQVRGLDITRTGDAGSLVLAGTLDNRDDSLAVTADRPWKLMGIIQGGRVESPDGLPLVATGNNPVLDGVDVAADLEVRGLLRLRNHTTLAGRRTTIASGHLVAEQPLDLLPFSELLITNPGYGSADLYTAGGHPLTLFPNARIRAIAGGPIVGHKDAPLINRGTISAEAAGRVFRLIGSSVTNTGTLAALNGATLSVDNLAGNANHVSIAPGSHVQLRGTFTLDDPVTVPAGGSLFLGGDWQNSGGISVDGGELRLGSLPENYGPVTLNDARIVVAAEVGSDLLQSLPPASVFVQYGSVRNEGRSIHLTNARSWAMETGVIHGGTLSADPGQSLTIRGWEGSVMDAVTIVGNVSICLANEGARYLLHFQNNLTLDDATLRLASVGEYPATVHAGDDAILGGTGSIVFDGLSPGARIRFGGNSIIGPAITLRTGTSDGSISTSGILTNQGILVADGAGRTLSFSSGSIENTGAIQGRNGGSLNNQASIINRGILRSQTLVNHNGIDHRSGVADLGRVTGFGWIAVAAEQRLDAELIQQGWLQLYDQAHVALAPGRHTDDLNVAVLEIAPTATLDLNNQDFLVPYPSASAFAAGLNDLEALIRSGRNAGNEGLWSGPGIVSSAAREQEHHTLALLPNRSDAGSPRLIEFHGQLLNANSLLILYTLTGDTDFDGRLTADDYTRLDRGFMTRLAGYHNGDFNYDGRIDEQDYLLIDAAFEFQATLPTPDPAIPEPSTAAVFGIAALIAATRRRLHAA